MLGWLATAGATTLVVGPGGRYPTLTDAVYASAPGDEVVLTAAGSPYAASATPALHALTIRGELPTVEVHPDTGAGAVPVSAPGGVVVLRDLVVDGGGVGRGVLVLAGGLLLDHVTVRHARAEGGGGGVTCVDACEGVVAQRSTFEDCASGSSGGALRVTGDLTLLASSFVGGASLGGGGAAAVDGGGTLTVAGCSFTGSVATSAGGALWVRDSALVVTGSRFQGNAAGDLGGGAVYVFGTSTAVVAGCVFDDNTSGSREGGGALRAAGLETTVEGTFFLRNRAAMGSGGAVAHRGLGRYDGSWFCANEAADHGGALAVLGGDVTATGDAFALNVAEERGGSVFVGVEGTLALDHATAAGSAAPEGSGVSAGGAAALASVYLAGHAASAALEGNVTCAGCWLDDNPGGDTDGATLVPPTTTDDAGLPSPDDACDPWVLEPPAGSPLAVAGAHAWAGPSPLPPRPPDADGDGVAWLDCDDADPLVFPFAPEVVGDGVDQDCDGVEFCYVDADGDGARTGAVLPGSTLPGASGACTEAGAAVATAPLDCDDGAPDRFPGAPEVAGDSADQDCDGADSCFVDGDGDGVGGAMVTRDEPCVGPGWAVVGGDCADDDPARSPLATDAPGDAVDDDCDGAWSCWADADRDGARSTVVSLLDAPCGPGGRTTDPVDCDDHDPGRGPGSTEVRGDDVDQDCDGYDPPAAGGGEPPPAPPAERGCGCQGAPGAGAAGALLVVGLARRRRR